jgi:hypothetical protein
MDLQNKNELLSAQELELLNDFQMEELEERMEMDGWFAHEGGNQGSGTVTGGTAGYAF